MSDFDFLKQYITEPGMKIDSSKKHVFYRLSDEQIKEAEDRWGRKFPKELRNFFTEIGYGFVCHSFQSRFNRLMDPEGIVDFIFGEEFYADDIRRDDYDQENLLVFFEVSEISCLTMDLDKENGNGQCPIYYEDELIANSLEEFLIKMDQHSNYYR
ncbi:SMI1/KNR4 family protein [Brevibacillus laterosporus]|uniref:SMI1/KNR4 family protein n=1 Tax=Brevibacillus laterosporus TaxID=1465 RepID=UPI0018CF7096|nr:SMI1/KNR4 family protein [Brevibacillus laterosporus]MBG9796341.1 hypothetical protein [Brevibacillus laterosporus]MCR8937351.1 SMI1/KNR4 family protein [Brevibacillus laterosporus]MCZ0839990.1 SMI1/KNR4 family protein [Brevibacillus laterosporus]MCZ0843440.1 SMI1/KNR4 family protein [Brevibacillus laterosporus]MED1910090.1 SMI1/KNR4 family protein [Brevibacillus laterosporus]